MTCRVGSKETALLLTVSRDKIYLKPQRYTFNQSEWFSGKVVVLEPCTAAKETALLPSELIREVNDDLILVKQVVAL